MNWEDPIVADVRRTRENLSAQFNFDLPAIFADLRARQCAAGDRLVRLKQDQKTEESSAPVSESQRESQRGRG
jgi:hypothetical protein